MSEASLALQSALRGLLTANSDVVALVPAANIFDRTTRPERFPCVTIGDALAVNVSKTYPRRHFRVYSSLHCWTKENGLAEVKTLAGAVEGALMNVVPALSGCRALGSQISKVTFMRDPAGENGHAVLTFESLVELDL